ncbi:putative DNA binding domain-containing protein [Flavobacterium sp. HXWNR29]|jgi:ATP-dependent DNA helicase RecG|uniref:ATP-binding protein n=1 Tax=Flavobacterium odoriferum TaxID=2946604 RepID=UPI0021CB4CAC|nr:ATP-binding protein [Flavobacterium sp. HXWNR29]MCU4187647.1 putative DNA binding domain-containing protein [Flavobacterium sp. HXWNR29]
MEQEKLINIVNDLAKQPNESEWVEFKHNYHSAEEIGERISALANGACLHNQPFGYLVYGIEDKTHKILGTTFNIKSAKKGKEDIESWLINRLEPKIDFRTHCFEYKEGINISLVIIPSAINRPVSFLHKPYVRISSYTRNLNEFPEKEAKIWRKEPVKPLEEQLIKQKLTSNEVVNLLNTQTYFELLKLPYPNNQEAVIEKFVSEKFIKKNKDSYDITKLGAILLAKNLDEFEEVGRKAVRVIVYKGKNKIDTIREQIGKRGYAVGFEGLIDWINGQLPANEEIGRAFRSETRMYPEIAIRELVANAIIHQDFSEKGFPMIEIFSDRIEISNPGIPLITPQRFIDEYVSRNERLADVLRRFGMCEEKGSGIDKVIFYNEMYQLPAVDFIVSEKRTRITLFSYKDLSKLDKKDKIRACYQHACLRYVSNDIMTNQSLRERFQIEEQNSAIASRIIKDTINDGLIKDDDPMSNSRKYKKYIPFWA